MPSCFALLAGANHTVLHPPSPSPHLTPSLRSAALSVVAGRRTLRFEGPMSVCAFLLSYFRPSSPDCLMRAGINFPWCPCACHLSEVACLLARPAPQQFKQPEARNAEPLVFNKAWPWVPPCQTARMETQNRPVGRGPKSKECHCRSAISRPSSRTASSGLGKTECSPAS